MTPKQIIDNGPMHWRQWMAVAITIGLNALDGFDVLSSAFAGPGIKQEWNLGPDGLGVVLAMELIGMGVGSPSLNAFMYELSEPDYRSLNANLMMLSLQGGSFLGPILGSAAVGAYGYDGFLLVGAAACLLGLGLSLGLGAARPAERRG